ncbi:hypothetical protein GCM10010109_48660 [Actinoplanes campanulatus]|nr:hypothetical protein GCM10010109_48660 [Actinoplanes campanulatus]GID42230.1 hypothetical protein Aca09nite_87360 [Actinoplanes campanulatus]
MWAPARAIGVVGAHAHRLVRPPQPRAHHDRRNGGERAGPVFGEQEGDQRLGGTGGREREPAAPVLGKQDSDERPSASGRPKAGRWATELRGSTDLSPAGAAQT